MRRLTRIALVGKEEEPIAAMTEDRRHGYASTETLAAPFPKSLSFSRRQERGLAVVWKALLAVDVAAVQLLMASGP